MTNNMKLFIEHNKKYLVIEAERLTKDGYRVHTKTDLDNSDRVRYTFTDGGWIVLTTKDAISSNYEPIWQFE